MATHPNYHTNDSPRDQHINMDNHNHGLAGDNTHNHGLLGMHHNRTRADTPAIINPSRQNASNGLLYPNDTIRSPRDNFATPLEHHHVNEHEVQGLHSNVTIPTPAAVTPAAPEVPLDRPKWKDAALEMWGTALFVYISLAGVHQAVLYTLSGARPIDQLHIAIVFTLGLTAGIIIALKSGAHLNPAVSFTILLFDRKFGFGRFIMYFIAQMIGAFIGACLVLAVYYSYIKDFEESDALYGSFGTLRNPSNSLFSTILDQFIGSALLMFGIIKTPSTRFKPLVIGLILGGLALFQGTNGFAFNPARDLSPRFVSTFIYGSAPFTLYSHWFWVPLVVPFIGMPVGYLFAKMI